MKDPAFLFYSNDFYGATRTMLPDERACYIDLMIYQHQNGYIPTDLRRIQLFCSGIAESTLIAVLKAKFKLCESGWYNERLKSEMESREEFAKNRSVSGTVGQFWKRAKAYFSNQKDYQKYRKSFPEVSTEQLYALINLQEIKTLSNPESMLIAMLKHLEDENEIENENKDEKEDEKGGMGEKTVFEQTFESFRKSYPGTKRGFDTEFKTLRKHIDWKNVVLKLLPALERQQKWRTQAAHHGAFVPGWPILQTWLNQRRWEEELNFDFSNASNGRNNQTAGNGGNVSDDYKRRVLEEMGISPGNGNPE